MGSVAVVVCYFGSPNHRDLWRFSKLLLTYVCLFFAFKFNIISSSFEFVQVTFVCVDELVQVVEQMSVELQALLFAHELSRLLHVLFVVDLEGSEGAWIIILLPSAVVALKTFTVSHETEMDELANDLPHVVGGWCMLEPLAVREVEHTVRPVFSDQRFVAFLLSFS